MGQLGFFDLSRRYEGLDVKDDPLVAIAAMVPWESLRPKLKASLITGRLRASDVARKSPAGRKPWDEVVIFKALVLQALYNLSDDRDRMVRPWQSAVAAMIKSGCEKVCPALRPSSTSSRHLNMTFSVMGRMRSSNIGRRRPRRARCQSGFRRKSRRLHRDVRVAARVLKSFCCQIKLCLLRRYESETHND
jgi:hypothetical protein